MYLWLTSAFQGGAGGDWGQRMSEDYILATMDNDEVHILEHEMGHGFGLPDFYEDNDRPPGGFPCHTIMWAGDSASITDWDIWMLRYTWSQLKSDTSRFPEVKTPVVTQPEEEKPSQEEKPSIGEATSGNIKVNLENRSSVFTNTLAQNIILSTYSDKVYDLSKLKIRYYYTADSEADENVYIDTAAVAYSRAPYYVALNNKVNAKIQKMNKAFDKADTYVEVGFNGNEILDKTAKCTVSLRICKSDWSMFNQENDYSYKDASKIAVYYDGHIISGVET